MKNLSVFGDSKVKNVPKKSALVFDFSEGSAREHLTHRLVVKG